MLKPLAAEARAPILRPALAGGSRARPRAEVAGLHVAGFDRWPNDPRVFSAADPDTLARAVRAHKAGDAFAQAALTVALMLAIGAVAFVLSTGRAAASGFLAEGMASHAATLAALAVAGGALIVATRVALRRLPARVQHRRRR